MKKQLQSGILLDGDFWIIFYPFFYFEKIFFICNVNYKDGVAYRASKKMIFLAIIADVLVIILFIFTICILDFKSVKQNIWYFATYSQYLFIFCCVSISIHSKNQSIYLLLQQLQEICMLIRNPEDTRYFKLMTRASSFLLIFFYVFMVVLKLGTDPYWHWTRSLLISSTTMFEAQLLNAAYFLLYLVQKQRKWIAEMKSDDVDLKILKSSFETILRAFGSIKSVYQIIIALHFVMTFLQILMYIEVLLLTTSEANTDAIIVMSHGVGVMAWFIKGVVMECFLCLSFEKFYTIIEATRSAVINHAFQQYKFSENDCEQNVLEGPRCERDKINLIHFGKCILRSIETSFSKLWACGLFPIDVTTPLQLGTLAATYIIVLLQFALQEEPSQHTAGLPLPDTVFGTSNASVLV